MGSLQAPRQQLCLSQMGLVFCFEGKPVSLCSQGQDHVEQSLEPSIPIAGTYTEHKGSTE